MAETDIVIPLGPGSPYHNLELRFALRSVEKFVQDLGQVWIISSCAPGWLQKVKVLPVPDRHRHNKDANLFDKLRIAARAGELSEKFVFLSDDQVFLAPYRAETAPTVFNPRGPECFRDKHKWHLRMAATFDFLAARGIRLDCNFDAHTPVVYRKKDLRLLDGIDYATEPGYCINTLLCGLLGRRPEVLQQTVKTTAESAGDRTDLSGRLFAGYNDEGFRSIYAELKRIFPEKSKFER